METAFLEGRFAELVELQLVPNADRVERPESGTGLVIAAAGMASIQRFDLAQKYAREALAMSDSSKRWLQRIAAESVLSECESHQGRPGAPTAKIGELGGLVGVLVARAWAAQGNDDALAELSTLSSKLRAPGIELGITVAAAS